ncbi:MAG: cell division protein, partial [Bacteroidetes bacterium]|nr:cell division protein [Bacteroidota bacterium]
MLSVGVVFNIVRIQTVEGAQWRNLADSLTTKYVDVKAKRGDIYASDGSLMATSLYRYDVHMDTRASGLLKEVFDEGVDSLAYQLSVLFKSQTGKSQADWKNTLVTGRANGSRYLLISKDVSHTELKQLKQFHIFNRGQFRGGLIVEPRNERIHPYGNLAVRTLGYMRPNDTDYVVGLEGYFNKEIGGTAGKILKQKVSSKVWIPINNGNTLDPIDGYDLYTTLDVDIQDIVENALLKGLLKNKAHNGCAIVMDVKTGEIKAIANLRRSSADETKYLEIYNYAIGVKSTPGSTFKLASLMALLDNGYMLPTDTLGTEGGVWKIFEDEKVVMRDDHDYGTLTLQRAFEKSSNIFF